MTTPAPAADDTANDPATAATRALAEVLAQAQALHADEPDRAADALLGTDLALIAACPPSQRDELLRLAEHVVLGHGDQGARLAAWLAGMETLSANEAASLMACRRSHAAVQLAAGETPDLSDLPPFMQVLAHYNAALARTRRRDLEGASELLLAAQGLADAQAQAQPDEPHTPRAAAALANNVAGDLRYYHQRGDAPHAALMMQAAQQARHNWARAGGWLEVERADWQVAMCAASAGLGELAVTHAQASLDACTSNQADAFEHCFAWQAMALARLAAQDLPAARQARAAMAEQCELLAAVADASYARQCLAEIDAQLARMAH
ncbi:hypothetical protein [Ideonella sp.]|uniref:hypothetical protein n=1 Tax=Ideonella sp. TaxID=1929293 RepID=UPI003BB4F786